MNDGIWDLADVSIEAGCVHAGKRRAAAHGISAAASPTSNEYKHFLANKIYVDYLWTLWAKTRVPYDGQPMEDWAAERYARLKDNLRLHFAVFRSPVSVRKSAERGANEPMLYGIAAGMTWAIETVVLGIALAMSPFCSTEQAVFLAPFVSTFLHDACSAALGHNLQRRPGQSEKGRYTPPSRQKAANSSCWAPLSAAPSA